MIYPVHMDPNFSRIYSNFNSERYVNLTYYTYMQHMYIIVRVKLNMSLLVTRIRRLAASNTWLDMVTARLLTSYRRLRVVIDRAVSLTANYQHHHGHCG